MAYAQDSTQTFTISLTALLEGRGIITWIYVNNETTAQFGEWDGATWVIPIPTTTEGDSILVEVEVQNTGATTDTLFGEFISAQVTPIEASIQEMANVTVSNYAWMGWNFTMPPNDVSITINAGHVE